MQPILTAMCNQRIDNGLKFLDQRLGFDWALRIDLERFNIDNPHNCVFGQLFAGYLRGQSHFELSEAACREYGFWPWQEGECIGLSMRQIHEILAEKNAYWREAIRRRQQAFVKEELPLSDSQHSEYVE